MSSNLRRLVLFRRLLHLIGERGLKRLMAKRRNIRQIVLKALLPIIKNRLLGNYALTDELNEAIEVLRDSQESGIRIADMFRTKDL